MSYLEARHQMIEFNSQVGHLTAGAGGLIGTCRALYRQFSDAGQVLVRLAGHLSLLFGGGGDQQVAIIDLGYGLSDLLERQVGILRHRD